jgi:hypothetical protein
MNIINDKFSKIINIIINKFSIETNIKINNNNSISIANT